MIGEIVKIQTGYTSYVDLKLELFNDEKNAGRISQYRPISSHRKAFEELAKSLNMRDKRCYLLTGTYGTGKSHLCLMFANYLQRQASEQPMLQFFANYAVENAQEAEILKNKRQSGHYLVALCDWGVNEDFPEIVLRAVEAALKHAQLGDTLDTPYFQASKKLEEWQRLAQEGHPNGHFYYKFEQALLERNPGQTLTRFGQRLANFDANALKEFRQIHKDITTAAFTYDKVDLISILSSALSSRAFKERFTGLLILFDEFGDAMERGYMNPKAFQQLAQFCADPPQMCAPAVFVGTAHKSLVYYAKTYNILEFRTVSDRVKEIPLDPEGVEDIIAAIVHQEKANPLWEQAVASRNQTFDQMLQDCTRLHLFTWLTAPTIRRKIIENIYPMHPMATFALLRMVRDVASNNRTVYTFFSEDAPGSFVHYINTTPLEIVGKPSLYMADRLFDYFSAKLQSDNKELRDTVREYIKDYESSIREQKRLALQDESQRLLFLEDRLVIRILRLMLIYLFVQIPNTLDNLAFGLGLTTPTEQQKLANCLHDLAENGILYSLEDQHIYEFRQSNLKNLDHLVEEYKRNLDSMPTDLAEELVALAPFEKKDQYFDAKDYNQTFNEDKRLKRRFVRAIDLGTEQENSTYFDQLDAEVSESDDFEGVALYVLCETHEDIQRAKYFCSRNASQHIVVAIPKQPIPLRDTIVELQALLSISGSEKVKEFTHQDIAALHARIDGDKGARKTLQILRNKLLDHREIIWYEKYAQILSSEGNNTYDAANRVMECVYISCRNMFSHDDFNKLHQRIDRNRNPALKDAIEKLLDLGAPLSIDTNAVQSRGEHKYLYRCLLQTGALRVTTTDGSKNHCELEANPTKYEKNLPTLAEMVREVRSLREGQKIWITTWIKKYRQAPYGQGPIALTLLFAYLWRLFGDNIRVKPHEAALNDLSITSADDIFNLIERQYPNAFLSYRPLLREEREFTNIVHHIFGPLDSAITRDYTVIEAHTALKTWWKHLLPIERVANLYQQNQHPHTAHFISTMHKIEDRDAYSFIFDDIPAAFEDRTGMLMTRELLEKLEVHLLREKGTIETGLSIVERQIMEKVCELFALEQADDSHILVGVQRWYNGLDSNQRDIHAKWHTKESRSLLLYVANIENVRETFLKKIPISSDYNLRAVEQWTMNRVDDYVSYLARGKRCIDEQRIRVEPARIVLEGEYSQKEDGRIHFQDQISLIFHHPQSEVTIYVTEGVTDPSDISVPRHQLMRGEQLVVNVSGTFHIAVQDRDGHWSPKQTLRLFQDRDKGNPPFTETELLMQEGESGPFPTNVEAFTLTCRSLFTHCLKHQILTKAQLTSIVQSLLAEVGKDE